MPARAVRARQAGRGRGTRRFRYAERSLAFRRSSDGDIPVDRRSWRRNPGHGAEVRDAEASAKTQGAEHREAPLAVSIFFTVDV